MMSVLEARGDNDYRLPYCAKEKGEKYGELEWKMPVKREIIKDARWFLRDVGIAE